MLERPYSNITVILRGKSSFGMWINAQIFEVCLHLVNSISWSKKARRRDLASRQLDFLGPKRREDEIRHLVNSTILVQKGEKTIIIRHLVNSTSWVQEDEKARSGISSTRLPGSKKARRRDPASRHLDLLGPRRREDEIRHLVNSDSWVQEDYKARSGISPASHQLGFLGPRRREGEIRHLVNSISWVQKGEKTRSCISSTRLLGPRRREGEIQNLVSYLVCCISPSRLLGPKKSS